MKMILEKWSLLFPYENPFQSDTILNSHVKNVMYYVSNVIAGRHYYGGDYTVDVKTAGLMLHGLNESKEEILVTDVVSLTFIGKPAESNSQAIYEGRYELLWGEMVAKTESGNEYRIFLGEQTFMTEMLIEKFRFGRYQPANNSQKYDDQKWRKRFRCFMATKCPYGIYSSMGQPRAKAS